MTPEDQIVSLLSLSASLAVNEFAKGDGRLQQQAQLWCLLMKRRVSQAMVSRGIKADLKKILKGSAVGVEVSVSCDGVIHPPPGAVMRGSWSLDLVITIDGKIWDVRILDEDTPPQSRIDPRHGEDR